MTLVVRAFQLTISEWCEVECRMKGGYPRPGCHEIVDCGSNVKGILKPGVPGEANFYTNRDTAIESKDMANPNLLRLNLAVKPFNRRRQLPCLDRIVASR